MNKQKSKHILLIWHEVPERVSYYIIPLKEIEKEKRNWLRRCHGNLINADGTTFNGQFTEEQINHAMMMVHEMVSNPNATWLKKDPDYFKTQAKQFGMSKRDFKEMYGSWQKYKLNISKPKSIPRCKIVESGIVL